MDLVSVYIPTKNRLDSLKNAINSVLNQTYKNIELIIVDDASNDNTWRFLQSIKNDKVKIFRNEISKGASFCRNLAILRAKGKFITGLDDDDEFLPTRIEKLYKAYNEKYAFVFSDYYLQKNNKLISKRIWKKDYIYLNDLYKNGNVIGNQIFTTKEKFIKAGLFDIKLKATQDYDMWLRLLEKYRIAYHLKDFLMIVNVSQTSITNSSNKIKGYIQVYLKHKKKFSIKDKKYHLANYLMIKNSDFFKFVKFIPFNKRGIILFFKYLKQKVNL